MKKLAVLTSNSISKSKIIKECDYHFEELVYTINFNDLSLKSNELKQDKLFDLISEKQEIPKTSQPSYQEIKDIVEKYLQEYENIIVIAPSRELSGTFQGCVSVANDLRKECNASNVHVVEAPSIAVSECYMVEKIISENENNKEIDEMLSQITNLKGKTHCFPSDVEFLKLSGRVNGSQGLILSLLKIRPIVEMKAYMKPDIASKARGFKAVLKFINEEISNIETKKIYISTIKINSEEEKQLIEFLDQKKLNYEIVDKASCVVATHFGPNSFGMYIE